MCELLVHDRETEGHIFRLGVDWYTVKWVSTRSFRDELDGMSYLSGKFGNMIKSPRARVGLYSHATNRLAVEVGKSET
jgi:hypothetical protein